MKQLFKSKTQKIYEATVFRIWTTETILGVSYTHKLYYTEAWGLHTAGRQPTSQNEDTSRNTLGIQFTPKSGSDLDVGYSIHILRATLHRLTKDRQ